MMLHWFLTTLANLIHAASPILKSYGLPAVFALLFIESAGVVFAPGEAMIVAAGFLAARGLFPVWIVLPLAMLASTLGGYAAYGLGGRYGHKALLRYGRYVGIMPPMVDKTHRSFHRFGAPVVLVGRFIVPLRQLQGYLAGAAEMGFRPFAIWSAMGAILWVMAWGGGAFLLAGNIPS
ncbi:DedA family protein [Acidithiobacillus ferrooxidans]|uniref:DedA family protein n=1 Tax=Acidithiobacillus ferrooxidans TaxID=920 RepID=UPI002147A5F0|nr:DedA family protein [Acidithiobacillus ferrooxidans]MCR1347530.1 DedA family protein [Acidithiobacillus ferrooxidans]MCR1355318.1 DedA family protein [Acidithiobacillus ferrooxidans]